LAPPHGGVGGQGLDLSGVVGADDAGEPDGRAPRAGVQTFGVRLGAAAFPHPADGLGLDPRLGLGAPDALDQL
jgi:hypothetical protein